MVKKSARSPHFAGLGGILTTVPRAECGLRFVVLFAIACHLSWSNHTASQYKAMTIAKISR